MRRQAGHWYLRTVNLQVIRRLSVNRTCVATWLSGALCLIHVTISAQSGFLSARRAAMQHATGSWLIAGLPSPSSPLPAARLPRLNAQAWDSSLPCPSPEVIEAFRQVYEPDGQPSRVGAVRALCDISFPVVDKWLDEAGMPLSYHWLPAALTGFNVHFTDAGGRSGAWAMDYLAARRGGLRSDEHIDERRDLGKASQGAAALLAEWHRRYDGQTALVMLAWMYSPALANTFIRDGMPCKDCLEGEALLAMQFIEYTRLAFSQLRSTETSLAIITLLESHEPVIFDRDVRYAALEDLLDADGTLLRDWNPVYIGEIISASYRSVPFRLDVDLAARFRANSDSVYTWQPRAESQLILADIEEKYTHRVRRGETLGGIASKHRVRVSQIKKWNRLRSDRIREGQVLVLYRTVRKAVAPDLQSGAAQEDEKDEDHDMQQTDTPPAPEAAPPKPSVIIHRVRNGETLWSISKKYPGVTPALIMEWNDCGEKIHPGQRLTIRQQQR